MVTVNSVSDQFESVIPAIKSVAAESDLRNAIRAFLREMWDFGADQIDMRKNIDEFRDDLIVAGEKLVDLGFD